jgi:hypothetical protein
VFIALIIGLALSRNTSGPAGSSTAGVSAPVKTGVLSAGQAPAGQAPADSRPVVEPQSASPPLVTPAPEAASSAARDAHAPRRLQTNAAAKSTQLKLRGAGPLETPQPRATTSGKGTTAVPPPTTVPATKPTSRPDFL